MGTGNILLSVSLMLALNAHGSFSQTAETKRDGGNGNLHPGRVILYRPVASNHDASLLASRDEPGRRYSWERNLPPFKQDSRTDRHWDKPANNPYSRDKERDNHPEQSRPYNRDKDRDRPYNRDKDRDRPYNRDRDRDRPYNRDKERDNHPEQSRPYNRDKERDNHPEQSHPYNRDKDRDSPYNRDKERGNHPEQSRRYNRDKDRDDSRSGFPQDASSNFRSERFDERKLPASKYSNDYFQPPRSTPPPRKQIENRNGFLFPGEHSPGFWQHRAVAQYSNVADYLPRHRFHNSLAASGYNGEGAGFKPRPGLLQGIPIPGSGIIVASGPGGVRHVIHDLRVPVHTHIHHDGDKTQVTDLPFRLVSHSFPPTDNNPYGNVNQAYKGVPIFIQGGTFGGKDYDPRFVALYRQVLEENQKKVPVSREKVQASVGFQSSPSYQWFSEPDPLYHPRDSALLGLPHLQLTTSPAFQPPTGFQVTAGSVELVGSGGLGGSGGLVGSVGLGGSDFLIHTGVGAFHEQPPDEQLRAPTEPPNTSSAPSEQRGVQHSDPTPTTPPTPNVEPAVTEAPPPTQAPPPDPLDEVISTSVSHSVSAIRLTRQRGGSNASEILETSHLTQKQESINESTPPDPAETTTQDQATGPANHSTPQGVAETTTQDQVTGPANDSTPQGVAETTTQDQVTGPANVSTPRSPAETTTQDRTTTETEDSITATESNEVTTEALADALQAESLNEVKPKAIARDFETSTTVDSGREATTTDTTESTTPGDMTTTLTDDQTEPTTSASELALTTLNYLVLSLVNQVRASTILGDNATTTLPSSQET